MGATLSPLLTVRWACLSIEPFCGGAGYTVVDASAWRARKAEARCTRCHAVVSQSGMQLPATPPFAPPPAVPIEAVHRA